MNTTAFARYDLGQCKQDFDTILNQGVSNITMIQPKALLSLKTEVPQVWENEVKKNEIMLSGKTLPSAYLVGWNPMSDEDPNKYVTPEAIKVFESMPYREITVINCPPSQDLWNPKFLDIFFKELAKWWGESQDSKFSRVFQLAFEKRFVETWLPISNAYITKNKKEGLTPFTSIRIIDVFTDVTFKKLEIDVYYNLVIWDGDSSKYYETKTAQYDNKNFKKYSVKVDTDKNQAELVNELALLAEKTSDKVVADFRKELSK